MKKIVNNWLLLSIIGMAASSSKKRIRVEWGHITLLSIVAFAVGWYLIGLVGAIVVALVVMMLMGLIKYQ